MPTTLQRPSGLQRQVLSLYRNALRAARRQELEQRVGIETHARCEFDKYRNADKRNYQLIEHLIRRGKRQLEILATSGTTVHFR